MAKLYAVPESNPNENQVFLGDYTLESAFEYLEEKDNDWEKPFMPGYDFIIVDGDERYILECGAWSVFDE